MFTLCGASSARAEDHVETEAEKENFEKLANVTVASFDQAPKRSFVITNTFDYKFVDRHDSSKNEWRYTPGIEYGLTDRLLLSLAGRLKDIHGTRPYIDFGRVGLKTQLTPRKKFPVDIGFQMTYELPTDRSRKATGASDELVETLILSRNFDWRDLTLAANFIAKQFPAYGGEAEWEYQFNIRGHVVPRWTWIETGLELTGDFDREKPDLQLIPSFYIFLPRETTLIAGLAVGLTGDEDDFVLRFILVKSLW